MYFYDKYELTQYSKTITDTFSETIVDELCVSFSLYVELMN